MAYCVELTPAARGDLAALPDRIRRQVARRIEALAANPRSPQCKMLVQWYSIFRVRSGDYRILYQIHDEKLLVLVIRIGHRRQIYRNVSGKKRPQ